MEYDPITAHIAAMVAHLGEHPKRAVYMVVKELYRLDTADCNHTIKSNIKRGKKAKNTNFD